jgi:hypothetical protein
MVILERDIVGFDHDHIDEVYAFHDDLNDVDTDFDEESFLERLVRTKQRLRKLDGVHGSAKKYAVTASNLYTLWALLAAAPKMPAPSIFSARYARFMRQVAKLGERMKGDKIPDDAPKAITRGFGQPVVDYYQNNQSATTELPQRRARLAALEEAILR